ncbi:RNA-directed DNA polymerase [Cognatishimia sp. 1_MG-2023]|uniref:RNA-directed DNA polymerase n=1 Tax=Cognatishimia sp. 1_MG-2023 TaxID=3062642 RepID=UPI0026E470DF|nr:RNA-directed DNA polymerase [Cognatishimia sp. 1_MG-2023]MDO6725457.1 RNA-directed DNA polymerase [Cognatishimia sp. 1_MG-2023]
MTRIIDLDAKTAKAYLKKPECYFRSDFPPYISFETILKDTATAMGGQAYTTFQKAKPERAMDMAGVNYELLSTKDGRFAWRPFELIHPAIYMTMVQLVCEPVNWELLQKRLKELHEGVVECTSFPMASGDDDKHDAVQVRNWWLRYEQRSLELSMEYTHLLKTDVSNCYGSLYTHSIPWALHGYETAKEKQHDKNLLGNQIDFHIRNSRYGQTNGITQGSVLMDIIAELVLAYVDHQITDHLADDKDFHILRYRDDYSIFTCSDQHASEIVRVISDCLRKVGMQLGAAKTSVSTNIVEGAIKPEKLAGIQLQDMDITQAKTIQKQLLRLHSFAREYPNTGAVKRLADNAFQKISKITEVPDDLGVQVAIVCDIAAISPSAFPALSGILAKLISLAQEDARPEMWKKVAEKMKRIPHNGHLEVWLQRVTKAKDVNLNFESSEPICQVVNGQDTKLWNNDWISSQALVQALDVAKLVISKPEDLDPVPKTEELSLFREYAEFS